MSLNNDLFKAMQDIVVEESINHPGFDEIEETLRSRHATLTEQQQVLLEASQFLSQQAIAYNEKRLMYASIACLMLSGMMDDVAHLLDGASGLMDYAESCWEDTQQIVEQAIAKMVWGQNEG